MIQKQSKTISFTCLFFVISFLCKYPNSRWLLIAILDFKKIMVYVEYLTENHLQTSKNAIETHYNHIIMVYLININDYDDINTSFKNFHKHQYLYLPHQTRPMMILTLFSELFITILIFINENIYNKLL